MSRAVAVALLVLAGCGYRLAGSATGLPEEARSISIRLFNNPTREHGLEVRLARAIEDEFRRHGRFRVVPYPEGDLTLRGDIRRLTSVPVAFSANDEAVQYQGVMQVSVRLIEQGTNRVIRDTGVLQATQDFGAVSGVVIPSSPHFQRGTTMDGRDLATMTNVQLGQAGRRVAVRELVDQIARDIHQHLLEDF